MVITLNAVSNYKETPESLVCFGRSSNDNVIFFHRDRKTTMSSQFACSDTMFTKAANIFTAPDKSVGMYISGIN